MRRMRRSTGNSFAMRPVLLLNGLTCFWIVFDHGRSVPAVLFAIVNISFLDDSTCFRTSDDHTWPTIMPAKDSINKPSLKNNDTGIGVYPFNSRPAFPTSPTHPVPHLK